VDVCKHVCGINADIGKYPRVVDISQRMQANKPRVEITLTT
jgi:hypothetical protein